MTSTLRITEVFHSLQGESRTSGRPTVFVRLTGCPLRCTYCDTEYAFHGGTRRDLEDLVDEVGGFGARYVCVTGGEPLAQPQCRELLTRLCDAGFETSLETSGALPIDGIDARVSIVLDLKTPGSGEVARNCWENVALLKRTDQVKFVLCDRRDYDWARLAIDQHDLTARVDDVLLSPSADQLAPRELAEWVLADRLDVRVQVQLHKLLWGNEVGR